MRWKENRMTPMVFIIMNMGLWLFFRGGSTMFKKYPMTKIITENPIQIILFTFMGFCVAWLIHAISQMKFLIKMMISMVVGAIFFVFLKIYVAPLLHPSMITMRFRYLILCYVIGAFVFAFFALLDEKLVTEESVSLQPVSTYRSQLMGVAMLYIMIFHTTSMKVTYDSDILSMIVGAGYYGVDIFMLVSGLGMTFAMNKKPNIFLFYWKRIVRIFPYYIPLVAFYTIVCVATTDACEPSLIFWNSTSLGYWFKTGTYVFNWYVPAIMLFYLLTPFIYRLLKNPKFRAGGFSVLMFVWMVVFFVVKRNLEYDRMIAFARFPVFVIGIMIGFMILEKKAISKKEYLTMYSFLPFLLMFYVFKEKCNVPLLAWHWLCGVTFVPMICIMLARLFLRIKDRNIVKRFLCWTGENSLLIYLVNVIIVRFSKMFVYKAFENKTLYNVYAWLLIVADILLVFGYVKLENFIKTAISNRKSKNAE